MTAYSYILVIQVDQVKLIGQSWMACYIYYIWEVSELVNNWSVDSCPQIVYRISWFEFKQIVQIYIFRQTLFPTVRANNLAKNYFYQLIVTKLYSFNIKFNYFGKLHRCCLTCKIHISLNLLAAFSSDFSANKKPLKFKRKKVLRRVLWILYMRATTLFLCCVKVHCAAP